MRLELPWRVKLSQDLPVVSVLLVDDRVENLYALEASLEPLGQRLVRATSGSEALKAVLDDAFAVILMDISMPELDGFETVEMLRARERSRHIPIIFISAYPEQHHSVRSYSAGAVDYILKPFDPETLRAKVSVFVHLRQHEIALQHAHAELEQRVLERTAELAAANRALEREIVERKAAERRLFELAHHDGLTGLANRGLVMEHLNRAVAQWKRKADRSFALMMIDLDHFKDINDTLGHHAGDQLLVGFAQRLELCLREVDTAARIGGDEFVVLVDDIAEIGDATRLAGRIQHELSQPFSIEGKDVRATASIGLVMMKASYRRGEELLRDADVAMYRAKQAGRARFAVYGASALASKTG